ncbi:MAG: PadR family transcriptional regulator [Opitutaceae bacterium]
MTKTDILQGTLDMLILRILANGSMHGWGIAERIATISKSALSVGEGSLYPSLYRMEQKGWISAEWSVSDNNRKAKFYALTRAGRKQLAAKQQAWDDLTGAIADIMNST